MICLSCGEEIHPDKSYYQVEKDKVFCKPCGDRGVFIDLQMNYPEIRRAVNAVYSFPVADFLLDIQRLLETMQPVKGDNWMKEGQMHPDHALQHIREYLWKVPYDRKELGTERKWHLISAACRLMFEYWHEVHK